MKPAYSDAVDVSNYRTIVSSSDDEKIIETAAASLRQSYHRLLDSILPHENALTIAKYIMSMRTEINIADHYRQDLIVVLTKLSSYISKNNNNKAFKMMTRQDILDFLNSFRKPDSSDPLHKWIHCNSSFDQVW
jgi:hypothetical protein